MKTMLNEMIRVGITETADPAFHLRLFNKLEQANIIITKRLTDELIDKLIEHKDKCILHLTVTGMGGTKVEPGVWSYVVTKLQLQKLLEKRFPVEQVVLRVNPIIPTDKGLATAQRVVESYSNLGITRCRMSILDMYKHVKQRFMVADILPPYSTFHAPRTTLTAAYRRMDTVCYAAGMAREWCGEPLIDSKPCISYVDMAILKKNIPLIGNKGQRKGQRKGCSCPANKVQLIPHQLKACPNGCLYCYWKDVDFK